MCRGVPKAHEELLAMYRRRIQIPWLYAIYRYYHLPLRDDSLVHFLFHRHSSVRIRNLDEQS